MRRLIYLFIISALTCLASCDRGDRREGDPREKTVRPNFILISLDTLRADRLGAYGYSRGTSPNLDKLAEKGAVFNHAASVTSWTLPAHVSMLSGVYPSTHKVTQKKGNKISPDTKLLAEILKEKGYRTFGFANGGYVSSHYGFKRGFEEYPRSGLKGIKQADKELSGIHKKKGGTGVGLHRARQKIESFKADEPFFIFVHTYDIHCPFHPPEPYLTKYKTEGRADIDSTRCIQYEESDKLKKEQVWTLSDRYDGNISWVDNTLGEFFDWFYTTEAAKNTYVLITSDHGEEFFEHNHVDHNNSLYKELVHIPFILVGPDIEHRRFDNPVSLVDIVPTVLELMKQPVPGGVDGVSYAKLVTKNDSEGLPVWRFAELDRGRVLRSAYDNKSNLILEKDESSFETIQKEYFYHPEDPAEQKNIFDLSKPGIKERFDELNTKIDSFKNPRPKTEVPEGKADEESPENLEELKSLGYF